MCFVKTHWKVPNIVSCFNKVWFWIWHFSWRSWQFIPASIVVKFMEQQLGFTATQCSPSPSGVKLSTFRVRVHNRGRAYRVRIWHREVFGRNCSEIVTKRASVSLLFSFLFSSDCYRGRGGGEEIVVPRRITQLGMLLGQNGDLWPPAQLQLLVHDNFEY